MRVRFSSLIGRGVLIFVLLAGLQTSARADLWQGGFETNLGWTGTDLFMGETATEGPAPNAARFFDFIDSDTIADRIEKLRRESKARSDAALRSAVRAAPDVIQIGEIRDITSMQSAIDMAGTGHLVLATVHSNNAPETLDRIINMFPREQHSQVFLDLV